MVVSKIGLAAKTKNKKIEVNVMMVESKIGIAVHFVCVSVCVCIIDIYLILWMMVESKIGLAASPLVQLVFVELW